MSYWEPLNLGTVKDGAVTFEQYKQRVQAIGVALLFAYGVLNSILSSIISFSFMLLLSKVIRESNLFFVDFLKPVKSCIGMELHV